MDMMQRSLTGKGRIGRYIQFDTMRKVRSTFSKSWESSPAGVAEGASFAKGTGKIRLSSCPMQSEWFGDFIRGAVYRMGYKTRSNKAVPISVMVKVLQMIKDDENEAVVTEARQFLKVGTFLTILTGGSLHGYKGFFTDLGGIRKHLLKGRDGIFPTNPNKAILSEQEAANLSHVTLCLLGDFKGESGTNYHMMALANMTQLGIPIWWWIEKLVEVAEVEGRITGPAFVSPSGELGNSMDYDSTFRAYLKRVQQDHPQILSPDNDIDSSYGISCTPHKTSEN